MKADGSQRETESVQQATKFDWLTRARGISCAEPSKTRPPSYVPFTYVCGCRAESDGVYIKRVNLTGLLGHVAIDAQNRAQLSLIRMCRLLWLAEILLGRMITHELQ
jgi:hypothetical protein